MKLKLFRYPNVDPTGWNLSLLGSGWYLSYSEIPKYQNKNHRFTLGYNLFGNFGVKAFL